MRVLLVLIAIQMVACGKDLDRDSDSTAPIVKEDGTRELACEAWHQVGEGELAIQKLKLQTEDAKNLVLSTSFKGFSFRVDWDRDLATLYMSVKEKGESLLFSTARVPSEDHNDSFLDVTLPPSVRLAISCNNPTLN